MCKLLPTVFPWVCRGLTLSKQTHLLCRIAVQVQFASQLSDILNLNK